MKRKTSLIWKMSTDEFSRVVAQASSVSDALQHFGLKNIGGNYKTLRSRMLSHGLDYKALSHKGRMTRLGKLGKLQTAVPLRSVLTVNSTYSRNMMKKRLIEENLLDERCYDPDCSITTTWNGKPLVLHLDHKNGINDDCRLVNLRLLCPNCHSQQITSGGKRFKRQRRSEINPNWRNEPRLTLRKVPNRPTAAGLEKLLTWMPVEAIGRKFGVSGNAVRKWCKTYHLKTPSQSQSWRMADALRLERRMP